MKNFKLHEQAEQMAAGNSAYELARRVIELEQQMKESFIDGAECFGVSRDTALMDWETSDSKLKLRGV